MDNNSNNREFWNFSDQLRLHTANLSNLSIGDSIWSDSSSGSASVPVPDLNMSFASNKLAFGFRHNNFINTNNTTSNNNNNNNDNNNNINNNSYTAKPYFSNNNTNNGQVNSYFNKAVSKPAMNSGFGNNRKISNNNDGFGSGKKKNNGGNNNNSSSNNNNNCVVDKRFKTLPATEALPRSEAVGGYIFVCNNDTMQENLKRQLFGLPPRYRDSVRAITPGLPLFLYNYSTHQLHGIFEAASFGGTNIDPVAWEDKKNHGESRFPAQVRVLTRKICEPLEEDSFRPILHHYDGPKFRLELSVPEALALLDIFAVNNA